MNETFLLSIVRTLVKVARSPFWGENTFIIEFCEFFYVVCIGIRVNKCEKMRAIDRLVFFLFSIM